MARLRQQHPQNYVNSGNIHTDFENLIRYVNSAELGNKTIGELFGILFNEEGVFRGPVAMRLDAQTGIQYRIGMYNSEEEGWQTIATLASLRGPAGASVGNVEGPFFFNRQTIEIGGPVDTVTVTAPGSAYTAAPTVTFSSPDDASGTLATGTATLGGTNGDEVVSVTVTNAGSGYSTPPTISFTGGNGSGATATCTLGTPVSTVNYSFDPSTEDIVVYRNGILLHEVTSFGTAAQYTYSTTNNTVTVNNVTPALANGDKITVYSVRSQAVTNFRRVDDEIQGATTLISFVHSADEKILVWRNGVLQEEGGTADYLASPVANTITFLDPNNPLGPGDKITVITVENQSLKTVAGLMFEDEYTDANGFIKWGKISVEANDIPQAKVSNLATTLAGKANITNSLTSPSSPATRSHAT